MVFTLNQMFFLPFYKLFSSHMGLGKTLQSLCIIAGDHFHREQQYKVFTIIIMA